MSSAGTGMHPASFTDSFTTAQPIHHWTIRWRETQHSREHCAYGISGNNVVGYYKDASNQIHGFLYNGSTYTTLDDPLGVGGTFAYGISGNNVVGYYLDASGDNYGFLYNGSTYTTLDDPLGINTAVFGIDGNNVVGVYTGASGQSSGFIATVPEPSSIVLFGFAALGLAVWDKWRRRRLSRSRPLRCEYGQHISG